MKLKEVGKTGKTHGSDGEIRIFIEEAYLEDWLKAGFCLIDIDGDKVPYFLEAVRGEMADIVKFDDINTPEDAKPLTNASVYLTEESISFGKPKEKKRDLQGYTLLDTSTSIRARILRIESFPEQEMAVLDYEGREIMIPLHDSMISEVDEGAQLIKAFLPEGIWDL